MTWILLVSKHHAKGWLLWARRDRQSGKERVTFRFYCCRFMTLDSVTGHWAHPCIRVQGLLFSIESFLLKLSFLYFLSFFLGKPSKIRRSILGSVRTTKCLIKRAYTHCDTLIAPDGGKNLMCICYIAFDCIRTSYSWKARCVSLLFDRQKTPTSCSFHT